MSKSVYSIVLTDEVVQAVDRLAYQSGTSRSNMIDRILAQSVSFLTPEERIRQVFSEIEQMLTPSGNFQLLMQPTGSMMSLRSALRYKYNPTVRYSIEMLHLEGGTQARLKVLLRTQSRTLMEYMDQFFVLWNGLEKKQGEKEEAGKYGWKTETDAAKYVRTLRLPKEEISNEEFGERIALYIRAVDEAMKSFFSELDSPEKAVETVAKRYEVYRRTIDYEL